MIDGKLDDQYWRDCPTASTGRLREFWLGSLLLARGDTLRQAGRLEQAAGIYRQVADDKTTSKTQRQTAEAAIKRLATD